MKSESRRNIRLDLSYDGTDFQGWQIQKVGRSVQGEMEKALSALHAGRKVNLTGSGRTDSGVHATAQVANFYSENSSIPAEKFRDALNAHLPRDIRILESREVPLKFHSRFDARVRVYKYYILNAPAGAAHYRNFCYLTRERLSMPLLNDLARPLTGTHDFTSFSAARDQNESKVRLIYSARFLREGPFIVFRIAGNAFLWKMVRTMVGTLLDQASKGGTPGDMVDILHGKDRKLAGPSAPSRGLFLHKVLYESETNIY